MASKRGIPAPARKAVQKSSVESFDVPFSPTRESTHELQIQPSEPGWPIPEPVAATLFNGFTHFMKMSVFRSLDGDVVQGAEHGGLWYSEEQV